MDVDVIIPWRETESRAPLLEIVRGFYRDLLPSWRIILADDPEPVFACGRAVNAGLEQARADVVVYQDADSLVPYGHLIDAVKRAGETGQLVKAFTVYHRLSRVYTAQVRGWSDVLLHADDLDGAVEWTQSPVCAMGVSAIRRESWLSIGGFDPRFDAWGYDDVALETLAGSTVGIERIPGPIYHLHHERRPEEQAGSPTLEANERLNDRYGGNAGAADLLLEIRREAPWPTR